MSTKNLERLIAFAFLLIVGAIAGIALDSCGGDIPTLPTLVFADDGGVDGGR